MSAPSRPVSLACLLLAVSGCGRAWGPERMPTTTIRGRVLLDGRPIGPGWLEIVPIDGTKGRLRSAPLAADGSFVADGVPVGRVAVRLAGRPLPPTGDPNVDNFLLLIRRNPYMRLTIDDAPGRRVEIGLRDQMMLFEKAYRRPF